MRMADPVDGVDHSRGADQRVAAARHRRWPRMRLLPGDRDFIPALALRAGHDADRLSRRFEDRSLLDMSLEISGERPAADLLRAGKADAIELSAECDPGQIVRPGET